MSAPETPVSSPNALRVATLKQKLHDRAATFMQLEFNEHTFAVILDERVAHDCLRTDLARRHALQHFKIRVVSNDIFMGSEVPYARLEIDIPRKLFQRNVRHYVLCSMRLKGAALLKKGPFLRPTRPATTHLQSLFRGLEQDLGEFLLTANNQIDAMRIDLPDENAPHRSVVYDSSIACEVNECIFGERNEEHRRKCGESNAGNACCRQERVLPALWEITGDYLEESVPNLLHVLQAKLLQIWGPTAYVYLSQDAVMTWLRAPRAAALPRPCARYVLRDMELFSTALQGLRDEGSPSLSSREDILKSGLVQFEITHKHDLEYLDIDPYIDPFDPDYVYDRIGGIRFLFSRLLAMVQAPSMEPHKLESKMGLSLGYIAQFLDNLRNLSHQCQPLP